MIIKIATKNKTKLEAVQDVLKEYPLFLKAETLSQEIDSGVSDQPKSIEETIQGAKNRAFGVFVDCDFSIGIESGLMNLEDGWFDVTVVSIYNGKKYALGFSCAWQCPDKTRVLMLEKGLDMTQAALETGLTKKANLGSEEGLIGILTKNRITRKDYTKQAICMALIQIENKDLYN